MLRTTPLPSVRAETDRELIGRCLSGDRAAERALFEREKRRVHATLYRILGSNQQIEDLLQDVFISVFRSLSQFRFDSSFALWIDRCAVHAAFAHLRKRKGKNHLELLPESVANEDPSAERRALAREAARRLYATLNRLEPEPRVAFTLSAIEGRPLSEVAELTGATVVVTKARVWRARKFVEKCARTDSVLADFLCDDEPPRREGAR